jgi:hypothetical protein
MEFQKIQVTKQGTLNVTYKNDDGDVIQFQGANIVHKDMKDAMAALTPHLAIVTEQREAHNVMLNTLRAQRITDEGDNIYKRMTIDSVSFSNGEGRVSISGTRILTKRGVIQITSPSINLEDSEDYDNNDELAVDVDAVKYEAREYVENRKWGVKQAEIDFKDIDPYKVEAGDVPEAAADAPKKRGRKPKKVA